MPLRKFLAVTAISLFYSPTKTETSDRTDRSMVDGSEMAATLTLTQQAPGIWVLDPFFFFLYFGRTLSSLRWYEGWRRRRRRRFKPTASLGCAGRDVPYLDSLILGGAKEKDLDISFSLSPCAQILPLLPPLSAALLHRHRERFVPPFFLFSVFFFFFLAKALISQELSEWWS